LYLSLRAKAPPPQWGTRARPGFSQAAPKPTKGEWMAKTRRKFSISMTGIDVFQPLRTKEFRDLKNAIVKGSDPGEELNFFINYTGPVSDFNKLLAEAQKSRIRNLREGLRLLEDRNRARQRFNDLQAASRITVKIDPETLTATLPRGIHFSAEAGFTKASSNPQQIFDLCVHGKVFNQKMGVIDAENLCFLELTGLGKIPGDFKNSHPGIVPTFKPSTGYPMPSEDYPTDLDNQILFRRCVDNKVKQGMTEEEATASCIDELGKALPKGFQPRPRS